MANRRLQCRQLFWRNGWSTASERAGQAPTGQRRAGRGTTTGTGSVCRSSGRSRGSGSSPGPHPTLEVRFNATRQQSDLASPESSRTPCGQARAPTTTRSSPSWRCGGFARGQASTPMRTVVARAIAPPPGSPGATTGFARPHVAACARRAFRSTLVVARRNVLPLRRRRPHLPAQPGRSVSRGYPGPA